MSLRNDPRGPRDTKGRVPTIPHKGSAKPALIPVEDLPPFGAEDQVLLAPDGRSLHLRRGCSVESFALARENGRVIAQSIARHDLGAPIRQLVIARDGALFATVAEEDPPGPSTTRIVQITERKTRVLRALPARVTAAAATPAHLVVAIAGADLEPAHLLILRRRDGKLISREALASDAVTLTVGRGEELLIREGRSKRQRWVDVGRRTEACTPPSPDREPRRPDRPPPPHKPSGCGCGGTGADSEPPDSSVPLPPPPRDPQDTCIPGDAGVPDGCVVTYVQEGGWAVSINLCEPDAEPCSVRLDWQIGSLARTPRALIAQSRDHRRVAVLDPATLRPLYEHRLPRQRVSALAATNADTVLLIGDNGVVQVLDPTPVLPSLEPDLGLASSSRVFEGQSPAVDWSNDGAAVGLHNVLIIPVMEPGQTFSGSIETYFDSADMRQILESTVEYYKEVSYHNSPDVEGVDLHFRVFGRDTPTLYDGPPIALDKSFRSYWGPGWNPGAVEATVPLPGAGLELTFSGDERLTLACIPEIRDPLPFEIRFPAASFRVRLPADPVSLDFGPAVAPPRAFIVDGTDRQGNPFGFTASTAALAGTASVDISEATLENGSAADALADALEAMLQTQPGGALFERPTVRWHDDGEALGMLHVTLNFAAATGNDAPTVTFFDASGLGAELAPDSGSSVAAVFSLPGDEATLARYLTRILSDATVEQPQLDGPPGDISGAYFELQEGNFLPVVDTSGGQLRIRINLSTADGRDPARIEVDSQTGLAKIGLDQAQSITGADVGFSGGGGPGIDDASHQRLADDVFTKMVDAVLAYKTGPEGPKIDEINRYFNCDGVFPYECAYTLLHSFVVTSVGSSIGVGATPEPDIGDLRGASRGLPMNDLGSRAKPVAPIGANRSKIVGSWMRFRGLDDPATSVNEETLPVEGGAATLMHELGHALLGLPDQYSGGGLRRDLRYIGGYDLMGSGSPPAPHPCAYHKRVKGWLADDAIIVLDRPAENGPIDQEVVLVQLEGWDPTLTGDAWKVIAHSLLPGMSEGTEVAAAVFLRLGGDGRHFDIVELRGKGARFSQGIDPSRVVISNAIDFYDDSRYAEGEFDEDDIGTSIDVLKRYRRKVHLIDDSLREATVGTPQATFDFAAAAEFPEVGLSVTVEEWARGSTGTLDFDVARLRIRWTRGAAIDLGFVDAMPTWQSPDIVLFRPDDYAEDGSFEFPESQSADEIERFLVPAEGEGPLLHKLGVRVWNFGEADALNVQVELLMRRPAGGGKFEDTYQTKFIDTVPPSVPQVVSFDWKVASEMDAHCCFRAQIGDRDVPTENGLALASDDTNEVNNWAQQNVFRFEAPANSPPQPVEFSFRVNNDGPFKEEVMLVPKGLGKGARVTVTPAALTIPRKRAGTFRVRVELEEALLARTCGKDISFLLEAWRKDDDAYERWGASKYTITPRLATETVLEGSLLPDRLDLHGIVKPDVGAGSVLLHVQLPNQPPMWREVPLGPGATFELVLPGDMPPNEEVRATARFESTFVHASSTSQTLKLSWTPEG